MIIGEQPGIIDSIRNYENPGHFGEYLAQYALNHDNLSGYMKTLVNLYIPYKGRKTELDVIMIHEKGIFVFESKNYSGWIFGSADQQKWTQCFPNKEKHQFYNPIMQNHTHIKALSEYLQLPIDAFSSYIIFHEHCELKKVPENTEAYVIVKRNDMLKKLRRVLSDRQIIYTHDQIDAFVNRLESTGNADDDQKKQHIEAIKDRTEGNVCPFCNSSLVERKGKFGAFYGCSGYPKCKYTRNIK